MGHGRTGEPVLQFFNFHGGTETCVQRPRPEQRGGLSNPVPVPGFQLHCGLFHFLSTSSLAEAAGMTRRFGEFSFKDSPTT